MGDLRTLTWSNVGHFGLTYQPAKGRWRKTAVIPITDELRALLNRIPRRRSVTILTSSRGLPWTEAGLSSAFQKAKRAAGITGLRFHDLRGTAATKLMKAGLSLEDLATILGWSVETVREIARRYVSADVMAEGIITRWNHAKRAAEED